MSEVGEGFCWGFGDYGQLGNGTVQQVLQPLSVGELRFAQLSSGGLHTCAITVSGTAYCWGYNRSGALGDDSLEDRANPVQVAGGLAFGRISSGLHHSCGAVRQTGRVVCWGYNRFGQLGDGTHLNRAAPADVLRGDPFFAQRQGPGNEVNETVEALLQGRLLVAAAQP